MQIRVFEDNQSLSQAAAEQASMSLRKAIGERGKARIVGATGASQFGFLDALVSAPGMEWEKVEFFHLDEYIGLPPGHPASFCKYLRDRLISRVGIKHFHFLEGEKDPKEIIRRVGRELLSAPVDVAFVGIGENGHLAFNDPPANFETEEPYLIVNLDEACRRQQVGEGWFAGVEEVPKQAISMSIRQILKSREILAIVPEARKANAVKACCEGEISPLFPASILRTHANTMLYLDSASASLLKKETRVSG